MTATADVPAATKSRTSATIAMAVTILLWASAFVVIRWAAPYLAPGSLALLRLLPASVALTLFVAVRSRRAGLRLPTGELAAASLIIPVVAMIMSALVLRELPPVLAIAGGLICLLGVVVSRRRA